MYVYLQWKNNKLTVCALIARICMMGRELRKKILDNCFRYGIIFDEQ